MVLKLAQSLVFHVNSGRQKILMTTTILMICYIQKILLGLLLIIVETLVIRATFGVLQWIGTQDGKSATYYTVLHNMKSYSYETIA